MFIKRVYVLTSRRGTRVLSEKFASHLQPANGAKIEQKWVILKNYSDWINPYNANFVKQPVIDTVKLLYQNGTKRTAIKLIAQAFDTGLTAARTFCNQVAQS